MYIYIYKIDYRELSSQFERIIFRLYAYKLAPPIFLLRILEFTIDRNRLSLILLHPFDETRLTRLDLFVD